eukprot:4587187-Lingulodinium_polyedra.AAC.1
MLSPPARCHRKAWDNTPRLRPASPRRARCNAPAWPRARRRPRGSRRTLGRQSASPCCLRGPKPL